MHLTYHIQDYPIPRRMQDEDDQGCCEGTQGTRSQGAQDQGDNVQVSALRFAALIVYFDW